MDLASLGWTPTLEAALQALGDPGLVPARVARPERTRLRLLASEGEVGARLAGRVRDGPAVTAGDWVAASPGGGDEPWTVAALLPRASWIARRAAASDSAEQVLAANVDVAFVVASLEHPVNPRRLERYLAACLGGRVSPVVVLNKADVAENLDAALEAAQAVAGRAPVVATNALAGDVDALRPFALPGRTVCFLGPSGAGKSTLANALLGEARLSTGEVREKDAKGRHTTTQRALVVAANGAILLDTPGLREVGLADVDGLAAAFEDVGALAARCRFRDCAHETEPGCAVRAAIEAGDLPAARLDSLRRLAREAAFAARKRGEAGRGEARAKDRAQGRFYKRIQEGKAARRRAGD